MGNPKSISDVDTSKLLSEIEQTNKSIMLAGGEGVGKSYILNRAVVDNNNKLFLVNGTFTVDEHRILHSTNITEIYHICLIIKKIIQYIKINYTNEYLTKFVMYDNYIDNILRRINIMYLTGIYTNERKVVDEELYENPELMMDNFLQMLFNCIDISKVYLIIDEFDKGCRVGTVYQKLIYEKLKKYMTVIMTISDKSVINDESKLETFSHQNDIVKLEYTKDVEIIADILDKDISDYMKRFSKTPIHFSTRELLGDEVIGLMIQKTKGNLFDLLTAIRHFYNHMSELTKEEYAIFILDHIDKEINKSPILSGIIPVTRKLYIKPE